MVGIWEVLDRATNTGPVMSPTEFDTKVFEKATKLAREHDIKYDPDNPLPSDDAILDRVFEAGFELYTELGTYCMSTERVIKFSEAEIKDGLRDISSEIEIGEGLEKRKLFQRKAEDQRTPLYLGGLIESNPQEGEIFVKLYQSIAQEKIVDGFYFGPPHTIEGKLARFGSPLDAHAHRCACMWVREALRRAGRPGLHLLSASPSAAGEMSGCNPEDGLRKTDAITVAVTSELKTDYELLMKVVHSLRYGCTRNAFWTPCIGGFAGGPESAVVVSIADALQAVMVYQIRISGYVNPASTSIRVLANSARNQQWMRNSAIQTLQKKTRLIVCGGSMTSAGPGTEQHLLECALSTIGVIASGGHIAHGIRKAKVVKRNQGSGLEVRFQAEVARAVAGFKRKDANDIEKELLKRFETNLDPDKAPEGKGFDELYDLHSLTPKTEYLETYNKVKEELRELGIPVQ
jgi:methylamine--corrinoid protein Co-methyltransferase